MSKFIPIKTADGTFYLNRDYIMTVTPFTNKTAYYIGTPDGEYTVYGDPDKFIRMLNDD